MKCVFIMVLVTSFCSVFAQSGPVLFGTTNAGNGGIFRYDKPGNSVHSAYRFKNSGNYRRSLMLRAGNGKIYGVALGGPYGYGVIYSLDPSNSAYKIEKAFKQEDGADPNAALVEGKNGTLYGTTLGGGNNGNGVLFSFDVTTSSYKVLLHFDDVGAYSPGDLTNASDGLLYGLGNGGPDFSPFLYSFNPANNEFIEKLFFGSEIGTDPAGSMVERDHGVLYGLMSFGGNNASGTIFRYAIATNQLTKIFDFDNRSGTTPNGTLLVGSDGKLYSTTTAGGSVRSAGTVFSFDPGSHALDVLHVFDGISGGSSRGGLTEAADGRLYGMTLKLEFRSRNFDAVGSIFFSIDKEGSTFKILRNFDHPGRSLGEGNFVVANNKIYGIALAEKPYPNPYIFSYDLAANLFQKIIQTNEDKGLEPTGSLLQATDGRFYGIAYRGGAFGAGGIFSFNPGTNVYTLKVPFSPDRGEVPANDLLQATDGKLYGVTSYGGLHNSGVIFSFDPDKPTYRVVHSFKPKVRPLNGFAAGADGKLYSMLQRQVTTGSEARQEYQVFSYDPATGKYSQLNKSCCGSAGIFTKASDGTLYASGEAGIYRFDPATNDLSITKYPEDQRIDPTEQLVEAGDKKLYALSPFSGEQNSGLMYSFDPATKEFESLYSFDWYSGEYPLGTLTYASDGWLYGTTSSGGLSNHGTIFSYHPESRDFQTLQEFTVRTGGKPGIGHMVELNTWDPPIVSTSDRKVFEQDGKAELTVSLNRKSAEATLLQFRTVPGTATDQGMFADFVGITGEIIIPAGEVSATFSIDILQDDLAESNERLLTILSTGEQGVVTLGDSIGRITIKDGMRPVIPPGGEIINIRPVAKQPALITALEGIITRATPNPTTSFFTMRLSNTRQAPVRITITNTAGQVIDSFDGSNGGHGITFGHRYPGGIYFADLRSGSLRKIFKLVKTSR